jgi:hypothetical protein
MNKKGSSLIETMVAMVLLLIITLSSAYFFAIPPFRKEALRFAALERAAGMLDLMGQSRRAGGLGSQGANTFYYSIEKNGDHKRDLYFSSNSRTNRLDISDNMPPVWYVLCVKPATTIDPPISGELEAELKLYDEQGNPDALFATFKMILPPGS